MTILFLIARFLVVGSNLKVETTMVRLAYVAYTRRLAGGQTPAEALRNTRQEFDLPEAEETQMLADYAAARALIAMAGL